MVQRNRKKDGTIVNTEATITDLGTLVIIDPEEDELDTMKSRCGYTVEHAQFNPSPFPGLLFT